MIRGAEIVSVSALEVPPPGLGLKTVMLAVPASLTSLAWMLALSCELLTKVVFRFELRKRTIDPVRNPEPFTVSEKFGLPAATDAGVIELMTGTGLLMVKG